MNEEYKNMTSMEIVNLYRNKYYNDGNNTEQGVVANAINDILPNYVRMLAEKTGAVNRDLDKRIVSMAEANIILGNMVKSKDEEIDRLRKQLKELSDKRYYLANTNYYIGRVDNSEIKQAEIENIHVDATGTVITLDIRIDD